MDFTLREMVLTGSTEATFDKCFEDSWAALNWVSSMKSLESLETGSDSYNRHEIMQKRSKSTRIRYLSVEFPLAATSVPSSSTCAEMLEYP